MMTEMRIAAMVTAIVLAVTMTPACGSDDEANADETACSDFCDKMEQCDAFDPADGGYDAQECTMDCLGEDKWVSGSGVLNDCKMACDLSASCDDWETCRDGCPSEPSP